jgi:hypothetical protein
MRRSPCWCGVSGCGSSRQTTAECQRVVLIPGEVEPVLRSHVGAVASPPDISCLSGLGEEKASIVCVRGYSRTEARLSGVFNCGAAGHDGLIERTIGHADPFIRRKVRKTWPHQTRVPNLLQPLKNESWRIKGSPARIRESSPIATGTFRYRWLGPCRGVSESSERLQATSIH